MNKNTPNKIVNLILKPYPKYLRKLFILFFLAFSFSHHSFAQGTTCSNATTLTINGSCSTNVSPNGSDSNPLFSGCGNGNNSNNVGWYTFTVSGGPLSVTITGIGTRNLAFQLIGSTTNNCSNLSEILCVNNQGGSGGNNSTETTTTTLSNGTYFIKVLNTGGGNLNLASLCVTGTVPENTVPTTGNNSITTCSGNLYDSGGSLGNYADDSDGYTVINPSIAGNKIRVSGTLITEGGYDYMTIYDGVGVGGTILWGGSPHGTGTACTTITVPTITSTSGSLTVRYFSDFSNVCEGFNLAISCIAPPIITSLSSASGCVGSSLTINGTNLSSASSVTIGGTAAAIVSNTDTAIIVTVGTGTTGNVVVTTPGGSDSSASAFTVLQNPTITTQPTAPAEVCEGAGTRTISVISPDATTYQWRRNGVNLTNTAPYSNVTTHTLTITNPAAAVAGNFDVVLINGTCSTISNEVVFNVTTPPVFTSNPNNPTVSAGDNASLTVVATNSPSSYLWQVSTDNGVIWNTISNGGIYSNATTATLNITNVTLSMNGYLYRARAANSCGNSSFSNSGILTVDLSYCTPSVSTGVEVTNYITTVNFIGNLVNSDNGPTTYSSSPIGYQNWISLGSRATQAQGEGVNIFVNTGTGGVRNYLKAWVDWNKDGAFDTTTEVVYQCTSAFLNTTFGFQIPIDATPGNYRIRLRVNSSTSGNNTFGPCGNLTTGGETEDYLFTVIENCAAKITSITDGVNCGTGSVTLNAVGSSGTTSYRWYESATGGTYTSTTSTSWDTPSISTTTTYYVTAFNGTCESLYRTAVTANVKPVASLSFSNSDPEICGENIIITLSAVGSNEQVVLVDEDFEGGSSVFSNNQIASPDGAITNWQVRTSTYIPLYPDYPVWYPAISSGFGTNKFAMSTSDLSAGGTTSGKVNEALELISAVNTTDLINLTLTFRMYFSSYYDSNDANTEGVFIEVDDGTGWSSPIASYLSDEGIGTQFVTKSLDLSAYTNIANLKIRIRYRASWCDGVAIDDIKLFGDRPLVPNFTWTSGLPIDAYVDLACTIPYTSGTPASAVYVKPTLAQLEFANYSFTANANLANGCTTSGTVNITNNTRIWKGLVSTDWNDENNWSPVGVPTLQSCVLVPENLIISGTNYSAYGKYINIKDTGTLTVNSNNNLIIAQEVTVDNGGSVTFENNSSLVQIDNAINTGNITYKRTADNIKGSDYIYWSSPVSNQLLNSIYSSPTSGPKYAWNTLANNGNGANGNTAQGNWVNANNNTMQTATGYIVRGSSTFSMPATNINSTFIGVPNNGIITKSVSRGSYTGSDYTGANGVIITNLDDNYNLIGNPYPCAINALDFLSDNSSILNGQVKLWSHGSDPSNANANPFYGSFGYNYSPRDYITINFTGSTSPAASDIIKAGQAFFVIMQDGPATTTNVTFSNSIRRDTNGDAYANDNFFKNSNFENTNTPVNTLAFERHRIWLDIVDSSGISNRTVIGYVTGATMDNDNLYDAFSPLSSMRIYSLINSEEFLIQGRALPFDSNDQVPLGFNVSTAGTYHIAINAIDGLFEGNQEIYLKDELLNIYHDLKTAPYAFTTASGAHNDRFKIVYLNNVLSNSNSHFNENEVQITKFDGVIDIVSGNQIMNNVKIYDIRGRLIIEKENVNNNILSIDTKNIENQVLIVNITTTENIKISKKVL